MAGGRERERIYLVPRVSGLALGLLAAAVFVLAQLLPESRAALQGFGASLVVAGIAVLILTNENLRGIRIEAVTSRPVQAGGMAMLDIAIRNVGRSEHTGLRVDVSPGLRFWRKAKHSSTHVPVIGPGGLVRVRLPIAAGERGRQDIPDLRISSTMPLGAGFAWKVFPVAECILVYPVPHGIPLPCLQTSPSNTTGTATVTGGEDVTGHQPYQAGDPFSRLDWRIYARRGSLLTRSVEAQRGGPAHVRWQDSAFAGGTEARLAQICKWILDCAGDGRAFDLDMGPSFGRLGSHDMQACLAALALYPRQ